ncbi:dolichyl-diphosphooligosaccharide--protein glycosyltransferase subunit 2 isoform X2 [Adelges cooleyi]|uniref:dolichyl-diphosphooligosaccharide--protein glycosyltransferase subunit 2 isoform X2 n=1 Tax=Adelges cooleyi TaxID=133065 RepID=UPI0021801767|nr:dolichyl-diphosphooligosaccharide--protein glycosyltransferase subunit 2 isoform X2 [Adelges cooleyi]
MKTVLSYVVVVVLSGCVCLSSCLSTNTYLSSRDKEQLKSVLIAGLDAPNVSDIYYSLSGLQQLGQPIPDSEALCKKLLNAVAKSKTFDTAYFASSAWKLIGKCSGKLPVDESVQNVHALLEKTNIRDVQMSDLFYGIGLLNNVNVKPKDVSKLISLIKRKMKPDDPITDFGYSINLLASLGPEARFGYNRLTDAIMQVDQVDQKYLQFEGGLSVTGLVLNGIYKFCDAVQCNSTFPLENDQVIMFGNYLLSRKSVQTSKGAYYLLSALNTLSKNNYHLPIAASLVKPMGGLDDVHKTLAVRFTTLLGEPLPTTLSVGVESAMLNNKVVMSKNKLRTTADKTIYELDFNDPDLSTGIYSLVLSAQPAHSIKETLLGNLAIPLEVKVAASTVDIVDFKVATTDSDQHSGPSLQLKYGQKLSTPLKADSMQRINVRFSVKDNVANKNVQVHQAFVRFTNSKSGAQSVFVAELDSQNQYKLNMDLGVKAAAFKHASGVYAMDLIIGDSLLTNPVVWTFGDIKLKFSEPDTPVAHSFEDFYKPKRLISHTFREPETRPPRIVSLLFTGLSLAPLLILFVLWTKLGVNVKNFPFSLSALGFHTGLGGIFALFVMFWLRFNMFVTLKYLLALGLATFLFGNRLLSQIARRRSK